MTSSPRYTLKKGSKKDQEKLFMLYCEKSNEGSIRMNMERSPDFFEALRVEGTDIVVRYVEDSQTGFIAGAGIRTARECYINEKVTKIGYLSGLRVAEAYRKSRAMAMIYKELRQIYLMGDCMCYLCAVFKTNARATKILTSGKGGIPVYKRYGNFNTFVFKPMRLASKGTSDITFRKASAADIPSLVSFLNKEGSKRQFFPHYKITDFSGSDLLLRLNISDICLAVEKDEIIGCLALWDQTAFRRWKVEYSRLFKIAKPFLNLGALFSNLPQFPKEGSPLNYRLLSLVCIRDNDKDVFSALYNESVRNLPTSELLISAGFFDKDPLIQALPRLKIRLKSTIFICHWNETKSAVDAIDHRPPYLEAGSL